MSIALQGGLDALDWARLSTGRILSGKLGTFLHGKLLSLPRILACNQVWPETPVLCVCLFRQSFRSTPSSVEFLAQDTSSFADHRRRVLLLYLLSVDAAIVDQLSQAEMLRCVTNICFLAYSRKYLLDVPCCSLFGERSFARLRHSLSCELFPLLVLNIVFIVLTMPVGSWLLFSLAIALICLDIGTASFTAYDGIGTASFAAYYAIAGTPYKCWYYVAVIAGRYVCRACVVQHIFDKFDDRLEAFRRNCESYCDPYSAAKVERYLILNATG